MSGIKQETPTNIILNAGKSVYIRVGGYDPSDPTLTPDLNETVPEEVSSGTGNIVISGRGGCHQDDGRWELPYHREQGERCVQRVPGECLIQCSKREFQRQCQRGPYRICRGGPDFDRQGEFELRGRGGIGNGRPR